MINNIQPANNIPVCVSNSTAAASAMLMPMNNAVAAPGNDFNVNAASSSVNAAASLLAPPSSAGIFGANQLGMSAQLNASQTEIKVERVTHHWTVKNFSHCYQEYLENFVNLVKNEETLTWSVKIYPKGNGENNKDFVFLCLNRAQTAASGGGSSGSSSRMGKIGFKSRFVLRNAETKEIEMRVHPNPSHSDFVSYIKRDVLFPQIQPKDIIVVTIEIDVAIETVTTVNSDEIFSVPDPKIQLINDCEKLFKSQQFSDFVIEVGTRKINTHRCLLGMRSSVFNAMLSHDTEESQKGVLEIKDLDYEVVIEMLYFIYCGKSPRVDELAADLLVAADKYSISDLKLRSEKALINALNVENACDLLTLADTHAAVALKERAVKFVVAHAPDVTRTNGWQMMLRQRPELVTEVVQAFNKPQQSSAAGSLLGAASDVYCLN